MRRTLGWILILHAFAHSLAGLGHRVSENMWAYTPWMIAVVGYLVAGLGVLRMPLARRHWKAALLVATVASMHLQVWYRPPWALPGLAVDLAIFIAVLGIQQPRIDAEIETVEALGASAVPHPHVLQTLWGFGALVLAYVVVVLLTRPTSLRWGSTRAEREATLPGDEVFPADAAYRIDHAITVRAPGSRPATWYSMSMVIGSIASNSARTSPALFRRLTESTARSANARPPGPKLTWPSCTVFSGDCHTCRRRAWVTCTSHFLQPSTAKVRVVCAVGPVGLTRWAG